MLLRLQYEEKPIERGVGVLGWLFTAGMYLTLQI